MKATRDRIHIVRTTINRLRAEDRLPASLLLVSCARYYCVLNVDFARLQFGWNRDYGPIPAAPCRFGFRWNPVKLEWSRLADPDGYVRMKALLDSLGDLTTPLDPHRLAREFWPLDDRQRSETPHDRAQDLPGQT